MNSWKTALVILIALSDSDACFKTWRWSNFWRRNEGNGCGKSSPNESDCTHLDFRQGARFANNIALGLHHKLSQKRSTSRDNLIFVPVEISSIISMVIEGSPDRNTQKNGLKQMRCYAQDQKRSLDKSVLVDTSVDKDSHTTMMMLIQRRMFADKRLQISKEYKNHAHCLYNTPISRPDFVNANATMDDINEWTIEEVERAQKYILNLTSRREKLLDQHPQLSSNKKIILNSKAIIASSIIMKLAWPTNLFSPSNTKHNQSFYLNVIQPKPYENSEIVVRTSMMTTIGRFPYVINKDYRALALPLASAIHKGKVIVVLPKGNTPLETIEDSLIRDNQVFRRLLAEINASAMNNKQSIEVSLPRIQIQMTHEFSIPSNQNISAIKNENGKGLRGDEVYVFQDTFLEMTETTDKSLPLTREDNELTKDFIAKKPFLFFVVVRNDLIAFGRIKNPNWCSVCNKND